MTARELNTRTDSGAGLLLLRALGNLIDLGQERVHRYVETRAAPLPLRERTNEDPRMNSRNVSQRSRVFQKLRPRHEGGRRSQLVLSVESIQYSRLLFWSEDQAILNSRL